MRRIFRGPHALFASITPSPMLTSSLGIYDVKLFQIMNKGGGVGGGGPTAAAFAAAAQKQKNLLQRVDMDINSIVDNFSYLVNVARELKLQSKDIKVKVRKSTSRKDINAANMQSLQQLVAFLCGESPHL